MEPINTAPLFRPLLKELLTTLRGLREADWNRPTVAGAWKVKAVAAHLLDGELRKIAAYRDGHLPSPDFPIESDRDLTRFVNALNATGVSFGARLSPHLIVDLLETTGTWAADLIESLDPSAKALWAVSWAGEAESANWMDTGREYTERWHHQMQIRDAVGLPRLLERRFMEPLLEVSVRAFPFNYRSKDAKDGTTVTLEVSGPTNGVWTVMKRGGDWRVLKGRPETPAAVVHMVADDAWRLLYNAVTPELLSRVLVEGDVALAEPMLRTRSVIV